MNTTNRLINETSPYLLQHANNPVDWYPWGEEAFLKAKAEDKPIFLSIGYSTCHWCHVMAHESFENQETADILNQDFVAIKVDKEERPDIDNIYMSVTQALTGSGGWPTSVFMTFDQKPFFAGTYFPRETKYGIIGFNDLLKTVATYWKEKKNELIASSEEIIKHINTNKNNIGDIDESLIKDSVDYFKKIYDRENGGFGSAPKFPTPHNLLFLLTVYQKNKDKSILDMVEHTLFQMYRGGIFDHIGYGFSRYSTDKYFLVPHFEKMLYDNALLIMAYIKLFDITQNDLYKKIAIKIADYILREMTDSRGGFYSAQDADSENVEGKYYLFDKDEIIRLLGEDLGEKFCERFDITKDGNFEGKNVPNLLKIDEKNIHDNQYDMLLTEIYDYRKKRCKLHLDDKILTSWNSLMISAFSLIYKATGEVKYLKAAEKACDFIDNNLGEGDSLYVSIRNDIKSKKGFLDDYAFYIFALINLYESTLEKNYLYRADTLMKKAIDNFWDKNNGGFYIYGVENEQLILKPKETYDGAIPCGNSVMCFNLIKLSALLPFQEYDDILDYQLKFMAGYAQQNPGACSFYLLSVLKELHPQKKVVCVLKNISDIKLIKEKNKTDTDIVILESQTEIYKIQNDKTTYYVCASFKCNPPTNKIEEAFEEINRE